MPAQVVASGCGARDLEVFLASEEAIPAEPPPVPTPPDQRMDARVPQVVIMGDDAATGPDLPPEVPKEQPDEDDEDASSPSDSGPPPMGQGPCARGAYAGTIECKFEASQIELRGPIDFAVDPEAGDAGLSQVTGQVTLASATADPVQVDGALTGTLNCVTGELMLQSPPLGNAVAFFLSATQAVTLQATYAEDTDSFSGDVSLPGSSSCVGSLSADPAEPE